MSDDHSDGGKVVQNRFFYGWVIVAASAALMAANSAIINSFGVFFKPLAADFGWSRATTSGVQSVFLISAGVSSMAAGWLSDRFGPAKILAICGCIAGLGLTLTSQVNALWQIYLTYSLMTGIGICSTFPITGTVTARWFVKRRGLALGLVSSGVGLGTFFGVPSIARLIVALGWSKAYFIMGIAFCAMLLGGAYLLRRSPEQTEPRYNLKASLTNLGTKPAGKTRNANLGGDVAISVAMRTTTLWILLIIFFLFSFCNQIVSVHLVNHATDLGVNPLIAATLISAIGLSSVVGRILMGAASDRIGNINTLITACSLAALSMIWLILAGDLWMFYLFAVVYGFAYGAEMPQQPALIGKFFGLQAVLVAIVHAGGNVGGSLGSWAGGQIFDVTQSYQIAFLIGVMAVVLALVATLWLGRKK